MVNHEVAVAGLQTLLDSLTIDVDTQEGRAGHGGRQRLSAAHAAHPAAHGKLAGKITAEVLLAGGSECFERSLNDALRTDVDPSARCHLAVHPQPGSLQLVELGPVRPVAHQG